MDILTIGEVLIDLTQTGKDARGIPQFAANPGGAPANLAVAASRLGAQTAFIGKVGADAFGRYLKEVLAENKVDVSGMAVDADHPTTMAVVSVDATGERDFSFYRSANADVMLSKEDISEGALKAAKIVHFGSVSLTADPSRTATLDAAARAKKLGAVITYDPNYRANLWKNKEDAIAHTVLTNRLRMAANSARVVLPCGSNPWSPPWNRSSSTAQRIPRLAQWAT